MNCPACNCKTKVVDSRRTPDGGTRRRRECTKCTHHFSTVELACDTLADYEKAQRKLDDIRKTFMALLSMAGVQIAANVQEREVKQCSQPKMK